MLKSRWIALPCSNVHVSGVSHAGMAKPDMAIDLSGTNAGMKPPSNVAAPRYPDTNTAAETIVVTAAMPYETGASRQAKPWLR